MNQSQNGTQWTPSDDSALLSHTQQTKNNKTAEISAQVGLKVNQMKTKALQTNTSASGANTSGKYKLHVSSKHS